MFFTATKGREAALELNEFTQLMRHPSIDVDHALADTTFGSWDAALSALARTMKVPTVVVVDEIPYLVAGAPDVEGAFRKAWDRSLKNAPVLLIVIGSDLAMMEALTEYGRPLYGRPTREIDLRPLSPHDVASLAALPPVDAFDAFLVTGGFPNLVNRWRRGQALKQCLASQLATSTEVLSIVGERMMSAEFPVDSQARLVLTAIGSGAPTFTTIGSQTGLAAASLDRSLKLLTAKRAIAVEQPKSGRPSGRRTRYRIADTYLAFWTRFIEPALSLLIGAVPNRSWRTSFVNGPTTEAGRSSRSFETVWPDSSLSTVWMRTPWRAIGPAMVAPKLTSSVSMAMAANAGFRSSGRSSGDSVDPFPAPTRLRLPPSSASSRASMTERCCLPSRRRGFAVRDVPITLGPAELLEAWSS